MTDEDEDLIGSGKALELLEVWQGTFKGSRLVKAGTYKLQEPLLLSLRRPPHPASGVVTASYTAHIISPCLNALSMQQTGEQGSTWLTNSRDLAPCSRHNHRCCEGQLLQGSGAWRSRGTTSAAGQCEQPCDAIP